MIFDVQAQAGYDVIQTNAQNILIIKGRVQLETQSCVVPCLAVVHTM